MSCDIRYFGSHFLRFRPSDSSGQEGPGEERWVFEGIRDLRAAASESTSEVKSDLVDPAAGRYMDVWGSGRGCHARAVRQYKGVAEAEGKSTIGRVRRNKKIRIMIDSSVSEKYTAQLLYSRPGRD